MPRLADAAAPTPNLAAIAVRLRVLGRVAPQDRADRIRLQRGPRRQLALRPASALKVRADPGRPWLPASLQYVLTARFREPPADGAMLIPGGSR